MYIVGIFLFLLLSWTSGAEAACTGSNPSWTSTPDQGSVQSCVNSATDGATINVTAGSVTWTTAVSWTNKNIAIIGAGVGNTNVTSNGVAFMVTMTNPVQSWRISGMTISGTTANGQITFASGGTNTATKGWRVDHMRFNMGGQSSPLLYIRGITWGLIDHVIFDGAPYEISAIYGYMDSSQHEGNGCSPHCYGYWYWNRNLNLGSDEAVYFEDITVNFDGTGGPDIFDLVYGGSAVLRHSIINGNYFITHSARNGDRGGMKYEVYNNTFNGRGFFRWAQLRSGTGVLFNNTVSGYSNNSADIDGQRENTPCYQSGTLGMCNGANAHDGNTEPTGWPCLDGCGRGAVAGVGENGGQQSNTPLYAWKNGSTATCGTGGTCNNDVLLNLNGACSGIENYLKTNGNTHGNGQVDYVNNGNTPKPGYTPYTYPHPLQAGGGGGGGDITPPAAPTNVVVQ